MQFKDRLINVRPNEWIASIFFVVSLYFGLKFTGGVRFDFMSIAVLLLIASALISSKGYFPASILANLKYPLVAFMALTVWIAISVLWSVAPSTTYLLMALPMAMLFSMIFGASMSVGLRSLLAYLLMVCGVLLAVLSVFQTVILDAGRPTGLFINTNSNAALMSLMVLPVISSFFSEGSLRKDVVKGIVITLLTLTIFLCQSRGALLGLTIALLFVFYVLREVSFRKKIALIICLAVGFVAAELIQKRSLTDRIEQTVVAVNTTATTALSDRTDIWNAAWEMYKARPYVGSGWGTFWASYPSHKKNEERSAGQHVHNDYLEMLVELGPVAVILLAIAATLLFKQAARVLRIDKQTRYEAAGIYAAVLAVSIHSLFTFNFYLISILIIVCLYIGWLTGYERGAPLIGIASEGKSIVSDSGQLISYVIIFLAVTWLTLLTISEYRLNNINDSDNAGEAILKISEAGKLFPFTDRPEILIARQIDRALREQSVTIDNRDRVIEFALVQLERAEEKFPIRWENYFYRAQLMRNSTKAYSVAVIEHNFQRSLENNPAYLPARLNYADYLESLGRGADAFKLLEDGWGRYYYESTVNIESYLEKIVSGRVEAGHVAEAHKAEQLLEKIRMRIGKRRGEFVNFVAKLP
ncbi:O-antigen ligase family protein [Candidatus Reidiella endopervernicosa]|nr:O-antigen ligase [Candidatus Reidiella endopervernicosa]